ncbi:MAG: zinc ribbon domain-containing protein [Burkholderiales bacterium]|nr:zinc ribbon domain-containing protein [Burkholderiales bacterium]
MPIYAYACDDCGHAQDFLQKISDPLIDTCPSCGSKNFRKQLTAAGFQLKGGGWYVTDFRDNGKKDAKKSTDGATSKEGAKSDTKGDGGGATEGGDTSKSDAKSDAKSGDAAKPSTPAPAASGDSKAA